MYLDLITPQERNDYLRLLQEAESSFSSIQKSPEALQTVKLAASAVRGSKETIERIKHPITVTNVISLKLLLTKARKYTNNYWKPITATPTTVQPITVQPVITQPTIANNLPSIDRSHISSYKHLLSPTLQLQAETLPQKYAELNDAHETLDRLVREQINKPKKIQAGQKQRMFYACRIDLIDKTIRAFWKRVDAELDEKQGQTVTDEYKKALREEEQKYPMEEALRSWGEYTKAEIERFEEDMKHGASLTMERLGCTINDLVNARIERNKKQLRRKAQMPISEEVKKQRILAMEELHEWSIPLQKAQVKTLTELGINVPEDYMSKFLLETPEEKLERKRANERRLYEKNKPLDVKLNIARKMRRDKQQDNPYLDDN